MPRIHGNPYHMTLALDRELTHWLGMYAAFNNTTKTGTITRLLNELRTITGNPWELPDTKKEALA